MRLELRSATVGYHGRRVLEDVSFTLADGEIGCLLGPSGCGKTTLLRAIAGFEPLMAGQIRADDQIYSGAGHWLPPERRQFGMVFQDHALLPHLTALDNVRMGLFRQPRKQARARAMDMLALVDLADSAKAFPHQLSGGQQQRVALARALAPEPLLVLLDEPFSALDPELRERLALQVRSALKAAGVSAILVTHSQGEAFAVADRIAVVGNGRLQQWASAYDLYHRPANRFVAGFIGDGVLMPARVAAHDVLETPFGRVSGCTACLGLSPGTHVDMLLRPDDVLHDEGSALRTRVVQRQFRGADFLYTLQLGSGERLLALMPSHNVYEVGDDVHVSMDLEHVVVFERTAQPA